MADVTKMVQLPIAQWSRPGAGKPVLQAPISATAQILTFTHPLLDENGDEITGNVLIGLKDRKGYTESIFIPPAGMSADGLTASGCIRGIDLSGLDYTTQNDSDLAVKHDADEPVICQISAVYINMIVSALMGVIATGANLTQVGALTAADISYYFANDHTVKPRLYWDDSDKRVKLSWGDDAPAAGDIDGVGIAVLTTAERDALTWPASGPIILNSTTGEHQRRVGSAWVDLTSGGTFPNASTTVAGKKEDPTDAEFLAGTDVGGTGATMSPIPSQVAKAFQNGSFISGASAAGTDAYAFNPTPAVTAYAQFQRYRIKADVANTPPCTLNVSGLGAVTIKMKDGTDPPAGTIPADSIFEVVYNSTGPVFELQSVSALTATTNIDTGANYRLYLAPIMAFSTTCAWEQSDNGAGTKTLSADNGLVSFLTAASPSNREVAFRGFPSNGQSSNALLWNQLTTGKKVIFETEYSSAEASASNEEARFGFSENISEAYSDTSNVTQMKFFMDDGQAKVVVCDGTGVPTTTNIAVLNQDYSHRYRIEYTVGESVVFKVDGVTVHTAEANIPLNTDSGTILAFTGLITTSNEANQCVFSNDPYIAFQK